MKQLEDQIFNLKTKSDFEKLSLEIFHFQKKNCLVYKNYLNFLNRAEPTSISEIPFLPISFFKSHSVITDNLPVLFDFYSSGTTGTIRSKHSVQNSKIYENSFNLIYNQFIGNPTNQVILALLPTQILLALVDKIALGPGFIVTVIAGVDTKVLQGAFAARTNTCLVVAAAAVL